MMMLSQVRNAVFATVAASAFFFSGSAVPKLAATHPSLLYVAGQLRMAMGDQEGGFRLLSQAAEARDARESSPPPAKAPAAAKTEKVKTCSAQPAPAVKPNPAPRVVTISAKAKAVARRNILKASLNRAEIDRLVYFKDHFGPNPQQLREFVQVAELRRLGPDFPPEVQAEISRAAAHESIHKQQLRMKLQHVREKFENDQIAVPAELLTLTVSPAVVAVRP